MSSFERFANSVFVIVILTMFIMVTIFYKASSN